jgi:hypothetical protein
MQAEIHARLVEAELQVRRFLAGEGGRRLKRLARRAAPVAAVAGVVGVAGLAVVAGVARKRQGRRLSALLQHAALVGSAPTLDFVRRTLTGLPLAELVKLLGEPDRQEGGDLIYALRQGPLPAAMRVHAADASTVSDVEFFERSNTTDAKSST